MRKIIIIVTALFFCSVLAVVGVAVSTPQRNQSYCDKLIAKANNKEHVSYLLSWAKHIHNKGGLNEQAIVKDVGIRPGYARVLANVDWDLLSMSNNSQMRVLLKKMSGGSSAENIDYLFFAEISRLGYVVRVDKTNDFDSWNAENIHIISEDVAVLCILK